MSKMNMLRLLMIIVTIIGVICWLGYIFKGMILLLPISANILQVLVFILILIERKRL